MIEETAQTKPALGKAVFCGCGRTAKPQQGTRVFTQPTTPPRERPTLRPMPESRLNSATRQPAAGSVVAHLETRDKLITIRTGSEGPLYTVRTKGGTTLAIDLSSDQLLARFPFLHRMLEQGVAVGERWLDP